jgi:MSHA pilin protein MshC
MKATKGFTLIELIVVIIVISILSTVGISLLSGSDQYTARLASDRWLAGLRLAQRFSLQKQSASNLVVLTVSNSASQWTMSIDQGVTNLSQFSVDKEGLLAYASTTDFSAACNSLPLLTFPFRLNFNGYGDSVSGSRVQVSTNQRICFVGATTQQLCISPSGYAYEGLCEN